jgi:protein gp37
MAENSKIEWTKHTGNLWHGCTHVHSGCDNCYAEVLSHRWGNDVWGNDKPRKAIISVWNDFIRYQKIAQDANEIHRVFVGSMMDIFEKPMPVVGSNGNPYLFNGEQTTTEFLRQKFFNEVVPNSPNLMFLLLTKRPSNINKYIPDSWKDNTPANVMYGTSPVDQETANKLIPQLLATNGKHFLSVEPQLDTVDLRCFFELPIEGSQIDWVIQGGESGHHKRPFNLSWAYFMKEQCKEYNVPYFFKQVDKIQPVPADLLNRQFPN